MNDLQAYYEKHKWTIAVAAVIAVLVAGLWYDSVQRHERLWSGEGSVELTLQQSEGAKPITALANMGVLSSSHGWTHDSDEYTILSIHWPNGGDAGVDPTCKLQSGEQAICEISGVFYSITVKTPPKAT